MMLSVLPLITSGSLSCSSRFRHEFHWSYSVKAGGRIQGGPSPGSMVTMDGTAFKRAWDIPSVSVQLYNLCSLCTISEMTVAQREGQGRSWWYHTE